jgi:hypothetical protein
LSQGKVEACCEFFATRLVEKGGLKKGAKRVWPLFAKGA